MYKDKSDNELLVLIKDNNDEAFLELIERYKGYIYSILNKYKSKAIRMGLDISDLYQEGLVGLINAVRTYNEDKDTQFKTYVTVLLERSFLDLIRYNNRVKHRSLNDAISLDQYTIDEQQELYSLTPQDNISLDDMLIDIEDKSELKSYLTEFELKVFELKLEDKTNKEIAMILDKNVRSIENTIQRIKSKINNNINV